MSQARFVALVSGCLLVGFQLLAETLPCNKPGDKRWPVKTTLPPSPKSKTMTLEAAMATPRLTEVKTDDPRYQSERIMDQPVHEDQIVTVSGWLYLVAFEDSDDCDFHIQLTPKPITGKPMSQDESMIVEIPSGEYATTIADKVEAQRQWVMDNLLKGKPPSKSYSVIQHPVYVTVTGVLFYDDAHSYEANGGTGRGKGGLESKTLWELHPVIDIKFAPKPAGSQ